MSEDPHFLALQNMYLAAPINEFYRPSIEVSDAGATIEIDLSDRPFHAAWAVHGSVYFKMLDDAAFFAANSLERRVFVLTTSFTTYLTKPVSSGRLRSVGRVVSRSRSQFIAEAVLYDSQGNEVGRGSGIFVRSKMPLAGQACVTRGRAAVAGAHNVAPEDDEAIEACDLWARAQPIAGVWETHSHRGHVNSVRGSKRDIGVFLALLLAFRPSACRCTCSYG